MSTSWGRRMTQDLYGWVTRMVKVRTLRGRRRRMRRSTNPRPFAHVPEPTHLSPKPQRCYHYISTIPTRTQRLLKPREPPDARPQSLSFPYPTVTVILNLANASENLTMSLTSHHRHPPVQSHRVVNESMASGLPLRRRRPRSPRQLLEIERGSEQREGAGLS